MALSIYTAALAHFFLIVVVGAIPLLSRWRHSHFDYFISIGAGVLLSAAFLHMLPSAIPLLGAQTGAWVLLGFLGLFFLEHLSGGSHHGCEDEGCVEENQNHQVGLTTFMGLSVHSIISGLALGVALKGNLHLSIAIAMLAAVLVHKVPETLALVVLLLKANWSKQKTFIFTLLYACMGPFGILFGGASVQLLGGNSNFALGAALAISCGSFLYIASSDLLPHLHEKQEGKWLHLLAFLFGLLILAFELPGAPG